MKKAMISQPMAGLTDEQIVDARNRAIEHLTKLGFEVVNTFFTDEWYNRENAEKRRVVHIPMMFFAKGIDNMSKCHAVYFVNGWEKARGCKLEHEVAKAYGVEVLYEE